MIVHWNWQGRQEFPISPLSSQVAVDRIGISVALHQTEGHQFTQPARETARSRTDVGRFRDLFFRQRRASIRNGAQHARVGGRQAGSKGVGSVSLSIGNFV